MSSKLEAARNAIADLKKSMEAGEDVSAAEMATVDTELIKAQQTELLKAIKKLPNELVKALPVDEDAEDEDDEQDEKKAQFFAKGKAVHAKTAKGIKKSADEDEDDKEDEVKSEDSVLLDMALEEIVRLRKSAEAPPAELTNPIAEDEEDDEDKEAKDEVKSEDAALLDLALEEIVRLRKANSEDEDEEDEKEEKNPNLEKGSDPGPTEGLKQPGSADYSANAEGKSHAGDMKKGEVVFNSKADFQKAVQMEAKNLMKSAGFVTSASPLPLMVTQPGNIAMEATGGNDLAKSFDKFIELPWKDINKFRMEVDPNLRNLSQSYFQPGRRN